MDHNLSELSTMDATGQAELVRRRELTPLELVDAAVARIERVNLGINAVISPLFEEARAAAISPELPSGPFRGVPFLLKDIGAMQKGQPYYMGNRALRNADYRSPSDTVLGARFRSAGFITLGKTNTPEFGAQCTTQPLAFGPTRNPWDLEHSTNGSSGGSCAAVATGMVPVAHANDMGGSIRLPAGWCGLVGLKPSRGRVSWHSSSRAIVEFVVTRTVRDAAAVLDAVQGSEPGDLYLIPPPSRSYTEELGEEPGKLRIGMLARTPFGEVHPQCAGAVAATAKLLESLGHRIEESFPEALFDPEQGPRLRPLGLPGWRGFIMMLGFLLSRPVTQEDVEPYLWSLSRPGHPSVPAEDYMRATDWQNFWAY
jgi:amidase